MRRVYHFSTTVKQVLSIARENGYVLANIREAEAILKKVADSVDEKLDKVILSQIRESNVMKAEKPTVIAPEDVQGQFRDCVEDIKEDANNYPEDIKEDVDEGLDMMSASVPDAAELGLPIPEQEEPEEENTDEELVMAAIERQEKAQEPEEEKPRVNPNKCPVCDRGCTSAKKLALHLKSRSKKCYKHAEYVESLSKTK